MNIRGGAFTLSSLETVKAYLKDNKLKFYLYDPETHADITVDPKRYCVVLGADNAIVAAKQQPKATYLVIDGPGTLRSTGLPVLDAYAIKPFYWVKHALPTHLDEQIKEVKIKNEIVARILVKIAGRKMVKLELGRAKRARLAKKTSKANA